jgi:hypothetical protein
VSQPDATLAKNHVHEEIISNSAGSTAMTWREMVGWSLVVAGSICGVAAAAIKGETFEVLVVTGAAFMAGAAVWGYTSRSKP